MDSLEHRCARFSITSETETPTGIIRKSRFSTTSSVASNDSETSSRRTSRVTFAPNLETGPTRRESSQSLPLQSALVTSKGRKPSSSHSEGSASSRRVSFIDELTGKSARPDPTLEERLRTQLEIVREAGEMGEFVTAASSSEGATPLGASCQSMTSLGATSLGATSASATSLDTAGATSTMSLASMASTASSTASIPPLRSVTQAIVDSKSDQMNPAKPAKKKSFCHLPEDDIKNKELFI